MSAGIAILFTSMNLELRSSEPCRAAALALKLDPEAVAREREDVRRTRQRTEARRENSGNSSFAVREADTATVLSVKAAIDELALQLRDNGAAGSLDALRAAAALDRLLGFDPLDRIAPAQAAAPPQAEPGNDGENGTARGASDGGPDREALSRQLGWQREGRA